MVRGLILKKQRYIYKGIHTQYSRSWFIYFPRRKTI